MSEYYSTYNGTISSTPLQYARDIVAGSRSDYLFIRSADNEYKLIFYEGVQENVYSDCTVFTFWQQTDNTPYNYYWAYRHNTADSVTVQHGNNAVIYGSADNLPHLREGVEGYAFSTLAVLVMCIIFCVIDRILRHTGVPR